MKLRNKNTGESINFDILPEEVKRAIEVGVTYFWYNYELYQPKEPLIKDEKIRKAVRAWADANGLNYLNCYESAHAWYLRAFNKEEQGIDIYFWGYQLPKELTNCTTYTIAELCGEEEECR